MLDTDQYRPLKDGDDVLLETEDAHFERVSKLLPNFPRDVLSQWIYRHWQDLGDYAWLDYKSFVFIAAQWRTEDIPPTDFGPEEHIEQYRNFMATSTDLPLRHSQLLDFMRTNGTWPRPIIVLDTRFSPADSPPWISKGPYHLLEGHNRTAAMRLLLQENSYVRDVHDVWIVTRDVAT